LWIAGLLLWTAGCAQKPAAVDSTLRIDKDRVAQAASTHPHTQKLIEHLRSQGYTVNPDAERYTGAVESIGLAEHIIKAENPDPKLNAAIFALVDPKTNEVRRVFTFVSDITQAKSFKEATSTESNSWIVEVKDGVVQPPRRPESAVRWGMVMMGLQSWYYLRHPEKAPAGMVLIPGKKEGSAKPYEPEDEGEVASVEAKNVVASSECAVFQQHNIQSKFSNWVRQDHSWDDVGCCYCQAQADRCYQTSESVGAFAEWVLLAKQYESTVKVAGATIAGVVTGGAGFFVAIGVGAGSTLLAETASDTIADYTQVAAVEVEGAEQLASGALALDGASDKALVLGSSILIQSAGQVVVNTAIQGGQAQLVQAVTGSTLRVGTSPAAWVGINTVELAGDIGMMIGRPVTENMIEPFLPGSTANFAISEQWWLTTRAAVMSASLGPRNALNYRGGAKQAWQELCSQGTVLGNSHGACKAPDCMPNPQSATNGMCCLTEPFECRAPDENGEMKWQGYSLGLCGGPDAQSTVEMKHRFAPGFIGGGQACACPDGTACEQQNIAQPGVNGCSYSCVPTDKVWTKAGLPPHAVGSCK